MSQPRPTTLGDRRALIDEPPLAEAAAEVAGRYRGYGELLDRWATLSDRGARELLLGTSVEGEPVFALEIGPASATRLSLIIAGLHAMEWIGVEVGLALTSRLTATPPRDRRVLYVPVVNVDGFLAVERSLRAGQRRYVRANANGVDLNRNFPTHYRRRHLVGRALPWLGHAGERPESEPEVVALCARLDEELARGTTVDAALSLHSFGRMLLLPWGGRFRAPRDASSMRARAEAVRVRLHPRYRAVQLARWWPGFFAHGLEIDYFHAHTEAAALLVECSPGGLSLRQPSSWSWPFRWYNPSDPTPEVAALAPALESFVRGVSPLEED